SGHPSAGSVEALLSEHGLPVLTGPVLPDGSDARPHPNDSLLALSFQAPGPPMAPAAPPGRRALSDSMARALTFSSRAGVGAGPLRLAAELEQLLASRTQGLYEAKMARSARKAMKRAAAAGASGTPPGPARPAAAAAAGAQD